MQIASSRVTYGTSNMYLHNGTVHIVETPDGSIYQIFMSANLDVYFKKSTNGGLTWGVSVAIFTGTVANLTIWYDKWSGLSTGLIHCGYSESVTHDMLYRTIDTESSDALSTQTTIFDGASVANGSNLSICRTRGGNVLCKAMIDTGTEGGFFRLPNANVPDGAWDAARTINEALAAGDRMIMLPGFAADNQDAIGIFWDTSANEISRQLYDDSADSWAETSIATGMTIPSNTSHNFAAAVDLTNSRIVLVAWTAADSLNADLRCWTITESAITEVTNVVQDSTDDQGVCALAIDTVNDDWYVFYCGKSDGSDTWQTALTVNYKVSTDNGSTWGAESPVDPIPRNMRGIWCCPVFTRKWMLCTFVNETYDFYEIITDVQTPRAHMMLGV